MIHHKTCPYQKFHTEAAFEVLGWTKPWATWAEFSVVPALSRRLDQKPPEVPSIWTALSFCEKLSRAGFCHFKTNDQVSRFLLAGAQHFKTDHHFWQKDWEPIFTRWPSGHSYTPLHSPVTPLELRTFGAGSRLPWSRSAVHVYPMPRFIPGAL